VREIAVSGEGSVPDVLLSLVVPMYGVAGYLPDFLDSLDATDGGLHDIELVFVDDGSTDGCAEIAARWLAARPQVSGQVVRKDNGGLASARNAGLAAATGMWISFPDPDDILTPSYLSVVRTFLTSEQCADVHLVATNLIFLQEATGERDDSHPLRFKFADGHHKIVDLATHPRNVHLSAASGCYRRAEVIAQGLTFDGRIRPTFEDAHLTGLHLAAYDHPRIALLEDAIYLYRKRADESSAVQAGWSARPKYCDIPRYGWLDLLRRVAEQRGAVPTWTQNLVLYDALRYFRRERRRGSPTSAIPQEWKDEFLALFREVLTLIDARAIEEYRITPVSSDLRRALLYGLKAPGPPVTECWFDRLDTDRRLVRVRHFRDAKGEELRVRGKAVQPVFGKVREVSWFGHLLVSERVAWLPAVGALSVWVDGEPCQAHIGAPAVRRYSMGAGALWRGLAEREPPTEDATADPVGGETGTFAVLRDAVGQWERPVPKELMDNALGRMAARSGWSRRRYTDAWLLTDGPAAARGDAEHLYRYLRAHQDAVNAWFLLGRDSPDWERLSAEGFRLLAFGSRDHALALAHAQHVIASRPEPAACKPDDVELPDRLRRIYLAPGPATADPPRVLEALDLVLTPTLAEQLALISDGSSSLLTDHDVQVAGAPRFDRLPAAGRGVPAGDPTVLMVPVAGAGLDEWRAVLAHAGRSADGLRTVLLTTTEQAAALRADLVGGAIEVYDLHRSDSAALLAAATVVLTDEASLTLDAAWLGRVVVHLQPGEPSAAGWAYRDLGLGPVTTDADGAMAAVRAAVDRGGVPEPGHAQRAVEVFGERGTGCCDRAYRAVRAMTTQLPRKQLFRRP
jgi:glycosyltransferase involved in cell wall biosynthesis